MPVSERAKQFAPFSAMRGLDYALAKKEEELLCEDKKQLSEEAVCSLNRLLCRLCEGMGVRVRFYDDRLCRYVTQIGLVEAHDRMYGTLRVNGRVILYDEISGLEILRK